MTAEPPIADHCATPRPSGRDTALIAVGQGALMLMGAVLALLIAQFFGKNVRTDAFFAAYGIYGTGLTFAQTFRLTAVSRLVGPGGDRMVTVLLGGVAVITLCAGVPMLLLADPVGALVVENDPTGVAPTTLRVLWVALAGQLLAALLTAALAVRGSFTIIGVATLLAGFISVGAFAALEAAIGLPAAAVGLAISAMWLTGAFWVALVRTGWRRSRVATGALRAMLSEARRLTYASATFLGATGAYVICVAVAAREGEGEATLFAYAYVLAAMLVGVTANVTAMARSPSLVSGSDRAREVAAAGVWSFRFTVVLVGPAVAMAALVGMPLISLALGDAYADEDVRHLLMTLICLVAWILASAGGIFAVVELLARGELRRLALLAVAQVAVLFPLALAGAAVAGIEGIAVALSASMLGATILQLRWAFGAEWREGAGAMARATGRELAVVTVAFAPGFALLALLGSGAAATVVAGLVAALLSVIGVAVAWPSEWGALTALLRAPSGRPGRTWALRWRP